VTRMNRIVRWVHSNPLLRRDGAAAGAWQVVGWWEARRIAFNLVVGIAGLVSGILCLLCGAISEAKFHTDFGLPDPPLFLAFGVAFYAIAANACFTGGWLAEIAIRRLWKNPWADFGPVTLALGVGFSVLLTLTPGILITGTLLVQLFVGPLSPLDVK